MENKKTCTECGCIEIAYGIFAADCKLIPVNIIFKPGRGSEVIAEVCTKCGNILNMRVAKPEKLK